MSTCSCSLSQNESLVSNWSFENSCLYKYDSPTVFKKVKTTRSKFWKNYFLVTLIPLLVAGIPVHLVITGRGSRINSTSKWLFHIFFKEPWPFRIFSLLQCIFGILINCLFFFVIWSIFQAIFLKGEISWIVWEEINSILRLSSVILPINLVWISGYSVRKLILSFDNPLHLISEDDINHKGDTKKSIKPKLISVYIMICVSQAIKFFILTSDTEKALDIQQTDVIQIYLSGNIERWADFAIQFLYNLMFPVYFLMCWALQHEISLLSHYLKQLLFEKAQPSVQIFGVIKLHYKQVTNQMNATNNICSWYISWVFLFFYLSMTGETHRIGSIILNVIVDNAMFSGLKVRIFFASLVWIVTQLSILGVVVFTAIATNDAVRELQVKTNDFVSESHVKMNKDLFKSFRLLKYYMHSRMETERPALLTIPATFFLSCGFFYNWMVGYRLRH